MESRFGILGPVRAVHDGREVPLGSRAHTIERMLAEVEKPAPTRRLDPLLCRRDVLRACREPLAGIAAVLCDVERPLPADRVDRIIAFLCDGCASPLYATCPATARAAAEHLLAELVELRGRRAAAPTRVPFLREVDAIPSRAHAQHASMATFHREPAIGVAAARPLGGVAESVA